MPNTGCLWQRTKNLWPGHKFMFKKLIFLISRSKVKVIQRSSIYMTHRLIVIHPYAKYGMPTSKNKEVMARTRICTHMPNMVCLPQRIKKLWPGHESAQTDGQTVIPIYPPKLVCGGYNYKFGKPRGRGSDPRAGSNLVHDFTM